MVVKSIIASVVMVAALALSAMPAYASQLLPDGGPIPGEAPGHGGGRGCGGGVSAFLGFRPWDTCLRKDANGVPQITSLNDIWRIGIIVIETLIKVAGYLAVGLIIWGGIKYLKSQGEPGETTQARQVIHNAVLGLVICIVSISIVQFIATQF